jgi:dTMP kinase
MGILERKRAVFVSIEGVEGAGKTTQVALVAEALRAEGFDVVATHEPGGSEIGRRIREILLDKDSKRMSALTELLLYNAARAQHLTEVIVPALERGAVVITDRFTDSTLAYQHYGRGLEETLIMEIDRIATGGIRPDMTVLLELPPTVGLGRNKGANKTDRFESESMAFHERVHRGFLELAKKEPDRFKPIDAAADSAVITKEIVAAIRERFLLCR